MLGASPKADGRNNATSKEMVMTRTDVRKIAWTLRLIGYGLLASAAAVMVMGAAHR